MDIIRERHPRFRKNAMLFWKEKLLSCYRHRMGEEMRKYHMNLPKEEVEAVKRERLRREEEEQNERRTAAEAEAEAELQRQRKEEFDARVERAVQIRERRRQEDMATSPERRRRRRGGLLADEGEVEESLGRGEQEVLLRRMVEVENLAQDQNQGSAGPSRSCCCESSDGQGGGLQCTRASKNITPAAQVSSRGMPNHEK